MYSVYLFDAEYRNILDELGVEDAFLETNCEGFPHDELSTDVKGALYDLGFFEENAFNDWWYDEAFAYYERLNKVFYEG
jgi:hypothetical protein